MKLKLLFLAAFGAFIVMGTGHAAAKVYPNVNGYFTGASIDLTNYYLCNVLGPLVSANSPCVDQKTGNSNQVTPALQVLHTNCDSWGGYPSQSDCLKANIITYIHDALLSGGSNDQDMQHMGAAFVVDTIRGQAAPGTLDVYPNGTNAAIYDDWVARVNQPSVTLAFINYTYTVNTAFSPQKNDIATYADDPASDDVLVFRINGVDTYYLRIFCGNPVGNFQPLGMMPQPTVVSCGTVNVPSSPEINTPIDLTATVTYSGGSGPGSKPKMEVVDSGGTVYNLPITSSYISGSSGVVNASYTPTTAGQYTVRWSYTINGVPPNPDPCGGTFSINDSFWVYQHPYFEVHNGDVVAGASFATSTKSCSVATPNSSAGVAAWNKDSGTYGGAGTSLAAFAMSRLQGFATNQGNGNPRAPTVFSFANDNAGVTSPGSDLFGGMFGSVTDCVDYWQVPATTPALPGGSLNNVSGTYVWDGATRGLLSINNLNVKGGQHLTIYVKGDALFTGTVKYKPSGPGWTSVQDIPSFKLIAAGRILIDSGVSRLDGTYIAVPDDAALASPSSLTNPLAGTIITCTNGANFYSPAAYADNCNNNTLTVNGSLVANQLLLLRTKGSVSNGTPGEVVNFTPESWLSVDSGSSLGGAYQSVQGLPPVL